MTIKTEDHPATYSAGEGRDRKIFTDRDERERYVYALERVDAYIDHLGAETKVGRRTRTMFLGFLLWHESTGNAETQQTGDGFDPPNPRTTRAA